MINNENERLQVVDNNMAGYNLRCCVSSVWTRQVDLHIPELTVRETFDFAARVQGTGLKAGVPRSYARLR